jgi:hypothetical protein
MTAKPGQTTSNPGLRHWKATYLVRMTSFYQRDQPMARKVLQETLKRLEGCSLETSLRSLCFFFSRSTALELRFRFLRSLLTLLLLAS